MRKENIEQMNVRLTMMLEQHKDLMDKKAKASSIMKMEELISMLLERIEKAKKKEQVA